MGGSIWVVEQLLGDGVRWEVVCCEPTERGAKDRADMLTTGHYRIVEYVRKEPAE